MAGASVRGALIAPDAAKPSIGARIRAWLADQASAQTDQWRLWTPVAFGGGCALYLYLKTEPGLWPLLAVGVTTAGLWLLARGRGMGQAWTLPLLLLACFAGGMTAAKLRAEAVATPIAPSLAEPVTLHAWVLDVDSPGQRGHRILIAPVRIQGLAPEQTPVRLRVTVRGEPPRPGEAVRLYGILNPTPPPVSPGAYDFGRNAYFQGMGGVVFALGETRPTTLGEPPWRLRMQMRVNAIRFALAERIVARLGPRTGGVAAAMTTGHETWIQADDLDAMRDSGLAHILSISGLHMAIVGGFVFFGVRLLVAAWPWLALRVSGKKVAAVAGLIAVGTYLVISGAPPPAERAATTASIAFLAVLLNRQAVSLHALAVAAFVVLLLQPEAVATPGFQMSFAATAALVALAAAWPKRTREISAPWPIVWTHRLASWLLIAGMASLVAGAATGPFAMQHFNRTAMYGLAANLATAPIADFIMMPALALGAALEPLGLGAPFLWVAGKGVDAMLAIGHWASNLPGAIRTIASAPTLTLPVAFVGILILCIHRGPLRWLGLPLALAVLLWPRGAAPDVWIGNAGANAAYRQADTAVVMRPTGPFATDVWSRRRGLEAVARDREDWTCGRTHCLPNPETEAPIALWWGKRAPSAEQMQSLCASAEIVSVRAIVSDLPAACAQRLVLDGRDYARGGTVELWRDGAGWRALWGSDLRGDRPWSRLGDPDFQ